MKKSLLIPIIIIFTALFVLLGANYLLSLREISYTLDSSVSEIKVYSSKEKEVGSLTKDNNLHLQDGKYYIIPQGENISKEKIPFTVEGEDKTITVHPAYTDQYLKELFKQEQSAIELAISTKYPSLYPDYTLTNHTLFQRGEWFGGLLEPKVLDIRDERDPYRIVLHKKDGKWEVVRRPEYILTSSRYSEVPIEILRSINLLAS